MRFELFRIVVTADGLEAGDELGAAADRRAADTMADAFAEPYGAGMIFPVIHDREAHTWDWGDWSDSGSGATVTKRKRVSWRRLGVRGENPRLTAERRRRLPASDFAGPGRTYPDDTRSRARAALARGSEYLRGGQLRKLREAIHRKYPRMKIRGLNPGDEGAAPRALAEYMAAGEAGLAAFGPAWSYLTSELMLVVAEDILALAEEMTAEEDELHYDEAAAELRRRIGGPENLLAYSRTVRAGRDRGENPAVLTFGANPPHGEVFGRVEKIWYVHDTKGPRYHTFQRGTKVAAMPDGSLRIFNPNKRVWEDDGK